MLFHYKAHRVFAALADNDSAGKGLVVHLNAKRPVLAVQCVPLDKVQVVYTGNLHAEKHKIQMVYTKIYNKLYISNSIICGGVLHSAGLSICVYAF